MQARFLVTVWFSLAFSSLLLSTCQPGDLSDKCSDGVLVEGICWPSECPSRTCPLGFFCREAECVEEACLEVSCGPQEGCAGGRCFPRDCGWRNCPGLGEVCFEEECTPSACVDVQCPQGQLCAAGRCYPQDCQSQTCPGYGEVCVDGSCVGQSCVGVRCPADQLCAEGYCYPANCEQVGCFGEHQVCYLGECVAIPCAGIECQPGLRCANGWCRPLDCQSEDCADPAEVCFEDACIPAECVGVECPADQRCARGDCWPTGCGGAPCGPDEVCYQSACVNWNCVGVECAAGNLCDDGSCLPIQCAQDVDCDDSNVCTDDLCDPVAGCSYAFNELGCDDRDACTMDDACSGGACLGAALDADRDGHVAVACGGTDCDDDLASVNPGAVEGPAGSNVCTDGLDNDCDGRVDAQQPSCGQCQADPDCDDGDACNGLERCVDYACQSGSAPDCDDGQECTDDSCDPAVGCVQQPRPNGTECGARACDGLAWTRSTCQAGSCAGSQVVEDCNDGQSCTNDTCVAASGCGHTNVANGTECGARYCGGLDWRRQTCQAGTCSSSASIQNCNDGNVCTSDACAAAAGCSHGNLPSGTACTSDGNACTNDVCNGSGSCSHPYLGDGASCGGLSAQRCCAGGCVDIRSNTSHCGGCGAACGAGLSCEDVASTGSCNPHPSGTSGRCSNCSSNNQCPGGQICRNVSPYTWRCAPRNVGDCFGGTSFQDISSCPNYCYYP